MSFKTYQYKIIKLYLKKNNLLFFSNGINQIAGNWVKVEQGLQKLKLIYHKVYNKLVTKAFKNSVFVNFDKTINGPFFFFKLKQKNLNINKKILTNENLKFLFFSLLAVKLNNNIYSVFQIKNINSLNYNNNFALFYQFLLIYVKRISLFK